MTVQLKKIKKELNTSNSKLKKCRADKHIGFKKLTAVKNELKESTATLLDLQSEHIETRKESRGAPFKDNLQKSALCN